VGTFVIQEAGPISIKTSQPELLQGGAIVFGVPGGTAEGQSLQIQSNQPRPAQVPATRGITLSPPEGETALDELGGQISGASPEMAVSDAPTTLGGSDLALKILHNVDRHIRAGDNDAVTVYAYLQGNGRSALGEVQVHLQPSLGKLEPNPLVIPAGELFGKARFSSEVAGESILRFVGSIPNLPLQDASEISVRFEPPIWNLRLAVSPPEISIIETASIVGELLDQDGVPTATDKTLRMSLKIQEGRGEIVPLDIVFNKGESTARAKFQPTEVGNVVISGSLPSLLAREGSLLVVIPWVTGILSLLGGGIGGTIAFLRQRKKWWRILIGVVTGVMIYWAAVFGFVDELTPGVALNPVTALVVSILGGIAGTGVITWMLKLFGLRAA
jgi:hypothetical protein